MAPLNGSNWCFYCFVVFFSQTYQRFHPDSRFSNPLGTTRSQEIHDIASKPQLIRSDTQEEKQMPSCNDLVDDDLEYEPSTMTVYKGFGLVLNVFNDPRIFSESLIGESSIGHTRYSTAGGAGNPVNIQPFHVKYKDGNLAIVHNGNITNFKKLHKKLEAKGTLFQTSSDSELLLHLIAQSSQTSQPEQILDALSQLEGAYCFLILTVCQIS